MKSFWRIALVVGGVGFLLGLFFLLSRQRQAQEVVLPDGSILRLMGALPGGTPYNTEEPWHGFLRRYLSPKYLRWLPQARTMNCGSAEALSLYFFRLQIPKKGRRGRFWERLEVLEEGGHVYSNSSGRCSGSLENGDQWVSTSLTRYPRRQKQFPVVLYDDEQQELARFIVKNPTKPSFPDWQSRSFPMTNVVDGTRVVLSSFERYRNDYGGFWRPQVEIESEDGSESPYRLRYFQFSDPTGNRGASLSPREPVWKSTIKLYRPKDGELPEEMKGHFRLAEIPSGGQVFPRQEVITIDGLEMRLLFFSGPGVTTITNGTSFHAELPERELASGRSSSSGGNGFTEAWESTHHFLVIETADPGEDVELLFKIRDQDGNEIERENIFHGYEGGNLRAPYRRRYTFPVSLSESVTALRVDCAINRGLSFDFLVNSSDLLAESFQNP